VLYVCATPIGNLDDVSSRVLATLRAVELIAAEDTRRTRKLLSRFDIHTPLTSLFAHNEAEKSMRVAAMLREGKDVALVTDAGMPGVSDPGVRLVALAVAEGLELTVLPGPSAVTTALVASGLGDGGGFRFVGYLPRRAAEVRAAAEAWRRHGGVVVAFETGKRLRRSLGELAEVAPAAAGAVCRELTKLHEEVARGRLAELAARYAGDDALKGEITLVVDLGPAVDDSVRSDAEARAAAASLVAKGLSRRDAAAALTVCLGLGANEAKRIVAGLADDGAGP
jgi:16S rRNA (cytidine1402-2'-O)-methyltransferase